MEALTLFFGVMLIGAICLIFWLYFKAIDLKEQLEDANDWIERIGCVAHDNANIDAYQKMAQSTNKYEPGFEKRVCCALGVASEAGEVAGKVDKCIRKNHNTEFTDEQKRDIALEIGDVLWFAAGLAYDLGYTMSDICQMNLDKLASRDRRNVICGSGDHR